MTDNSVIPKRPEPDTIPIGYRGRGRDVIEWLCLAWIIAILIYVAVWASGSCVISLVCN